MKGEKGGVQSFEIARGSQKTERNDSYVPVTSCSILNQMTNFKVKLRIQRGETCDFHAAGAGFDDSDDKRFIMAALQIDW